jgi:tetratricopeptide (TPR) repeat protein
VFSTKSNLPAVVLAISLLAGGCDNGAALRNAKLSKNRYLLGKDYLEKKQAGAARRELLAAIRLNANNADAHGLLGKLLFIEGVHADSYLERYQCLQGEAARQQLAVTNQSFRGAEKHLLRSLEILDGKKRSDPESLNYLSNIALHFKRYDAAVKYASKALDSFSYGRRHLALATRGWAYHLAGKQKKASADLREALFHQPNFCVGRYRLAKVLYKTMLYGQAVAELLKVTAEPAPQPGWQGECCKVCVGTCPCGDRCMPCDEKCIVTKPGCTCRPGGCRIQDAYQLLGLVYKKQKEPAKAKAQFEKCVTRNPKSCISKQCQQYAQLI